MNWARGLAALLLAGALAQGGVVPDEPDSSDLGPFQIQVVPGPEPPGPLERATVLDLVLDPEGSVLVAYRGERGIWKIDLAGEVSLHALIPGDGGEIRSLTLDPATGELQVRDASGLWKVTPAGEVSAMPGDLPEPFAPEAVPPAPQAPAPRQIQAPVRRGGLACLALLGLGALADPSLPGVSGLSSNRYTANAKAGLGRLGPVCAEPLLSSRAVAPCDRGYRSRVLAQVDDLHGQMVDLYVEPATLGPGHCLPGESLQGAKSRIALDQSDILVAYDGLNADASALTVQLTRDGLTLGAVGQGLLTAQAAAPGTGGGATGLEAVASFAVKEVATSLAAANQGLQTVGALYAKVASVALTYKAKYQRYANNRTQSVLDACTSAAPVQPSSASPGVRIPPATPLTSPVPALADAALKLTTGCILASQRGLDLQVCSQDSLAEVNLRNGTLGDLFQGISCLSAGVLQGRQSFCPKAPLADSRARSDTFAFFDQFAGEINAAAADSMACGTSLGVAASGLELAVNAAVLAGNTLEAKALGAAAGGLQVLGSAAAADAYELMRIGFLSRRWQVDVTLAFNVDSRARLDEKEAKARLGNHSSSTGTGSGSTAGSATGSLRPSGELSSSGSAKAPQRSSALSSTGVDTGAGLWPAPDSTGSGSGSHGSSSAASAEPSTNSATRTGPFTLGGFARLLLPRHEEF